MSSEITSSSHARRNRLIATVAGAITVIAIVLGFAGDVLGLPWHWMRPAAELLLLAELVGLVVLERHQLFEPVSEKVSGIDTRLAAMDQMLADSNLAKMNESIQLMSEQMSTSPRTLLYATAPELLRGLARTANEALAREQQTQQTLYLTRLSGAIPHATEDPEFSVQMREFADAFASFKLLPNSPPEASVRRWTLRGIAVIPDLAGHDRFLGFLPLLTGGNPLNMEVKMIFNPNLGPQLTPELVTDRDAVLTFNDTVASFRWGVCFRGAEYRALVARWLDDFWASIPDRYLIYSRNGINQAALDRIRKEVEANEAARNQVAK